MFKLKTKKSYWMIGYTKGKNPKHISYLTYGDNIVDVLTAHISNPRYENTTVVSVVQVQDYKEDY